MDPRMLATNLEIISNVGPSYPPATKSRQKCGAEDIELTSTSTFPKTAPIPATEDDSAILPAGPQTPPEALTQPATGVQTPHTPNELEANTPAELRNVVGVVPSFSYPAKNRWRVFAACLTYFGNGMNDAGESTREPVRGTLAANSMTSTRSAYSLHGDRLQYWICHRLANLCYQRRWLHHNCIRH